jgi:hypothetical protein
MNIEELEVIMNDDDLGGSRLSEVGCPALKGLIVIAKYLPKAGIECAGHDVIYSAGACELVEAGLTNEDAEYLRDHNWMISEDSLACFV